MMRLIAVFFRFQCRLLLLVFMAVVNAIRLLLQIRKGGGPPTRANSSAPTDVLSARGEFVERRYANAAGARRYKVYIPGNGPGRKFRALIIMLHGCTQRPDDFAAGTRMNDLADSGDFLVAYPAQSGSANGMRCWNWFDARNQARDQGEPGILAGITRELAAEFAISSQHIYIAGLSAGAAMAVTMGVIYPDLFAAVGVHSGLPYGAAHNLQTALAAMQGRGSVSPLPALSLLKVIVFHGDRDGTVSVDNGNRLVEQATAVYAAVGAALTPTTQVLEALNGREVSVTVYSDARKKPMVEYWVVRGGGHTWFGGSKNGSHTDARGPNASEEMIRFFFAANGQNRAPRPELEAAVEMEAAGSGSEPDQILDYPNGG